MADARAGRFTIDFVDEQGLSPLHYSCQYNRPQCAAILLLESGASIDLSCEAGFRPRELLQNDEVRQIFIEYYDKVDRAIEDLARSEGENVGQAYEQRKQIDPNKKNKDNEDDGKK